MAPTAPNALASLQEFFAELDRIVSTVDRVRPAREIEDGLLHDAVIATAGRIPPGVDPAVELAALRALHATVRYGEPWYAAPGESGRLTPRELTSRRSTAVAARRALTAAATAHTGMRSVAQSEAALAAARAYALVRVMQHGGAQTFARPELMFYAGLPALGEPDAERAASLCVDRFAQRAQATGASRFSGAGGCAIVSFTGDRRELEGIMASAPHDESVSPYCLAVIVTADGFRFGANRD